MDKQKILKKLVFAGLVCMVDFMLVRLNEDGNLILIFDGAAYDSHVYYYMFPFFIFACYSMYIHGEFGEYVSKTGICLLVRAGRGRLYEKLCAKLVGMYCFILTIHLAGYGIGCFVLCGRVYLSDIKLFVCMLAINVLVYFLVFLVQMILELWLTGRTAMYIIMIYYLASLYVGDCLYRAENQVLPCHFPFLPNIAMRLRLEKLAGFPETAATGIILLGGITAGFYGIGRKMFNKKDII